MTLAEVAAAFCEEVERETARRGRPPGGQQVTPCGDFLSAAPSTMRSLAIWARALRAALPPDGRCSKRFVRGIVVDYDTPEEGERCARPAAHTGDCSSKPDPASARALGHDPGDEDE